MTVAEQLHDYIRFRAEKEGVGYDLGVSFFERALLSGCVQFFGVTIKGNQLIKDKEQPDLFNEWKRKKQN